MKKAAMLFGMAVLGALLVGCASDLTEARRVQGDVMERAIESVPAYVPSQFPAREDINWYLRETESRSEWYVYALNNAGVPLFYVVSDMKPRNICISISSPDRVRSGVALSSPGLDGVYYGGAGCDSYYFRDAVTGSFIELSGRQFTLVSSKVPLALETDRLEYSPK